MKNSRFRQGVTIKTYHDKSIVYHIAATFKRTQVGRGIIKTQHYQINGNYNQVTCGVLKNRNGELAVGYSCSRYFIGCKKTSISTFIGNTMNAVQVYGFQISKGEWYCGSYKKGQHVSVTLSSIYYMYRGWLLNGLFEGNGLLIQMIGTQKVKIKRYFKAGYPSESGSMYQVIGNEIYCGMARNGELSGQGTWFTNSYYYIGDLLEGKKHGKGIDIYHQRLSNEQLYFYRLNGMFQNNVFGPQGVLQLQYYTCNNQTKSCWISSHCGEFCNNKISGYGTTTGQGYDNADCTEIQLKAIQLIQFKLKNLNDSYSLKFLVRSGFRKVDRTRFGYCGKYIDGEFQQNGQMFYNGSQGDIGIKSTSEVNMQNITSKQIPNQRSKMKIFIKDQVPFIFSFMNLINRCYPEVTINICGLDDYRTIEAQYNPQQKKTYLTQAKHRINLISYQGDMNDFGRITDHQGNKYKGHFLNNKRHGFGSYEDSSICYEGYFENNVYSGYGVLTEYTQAVWIKTYKGIFVNGEYDGQGILITADFIYVGQFKSNNIHGQGIKKFKNGEYIQGEWLDSELITGIHIVPWLQKYQGTFLNQRYHGEGRLESLKQFQVYQGDFHNNERHGKGIEHTPDWIYIGEFKQDSISGTGQIYWKSGSFYEGQFNNNKINGYGEFKSGNFSYYGQFIDDAPTNYGVITYTNGRVYRGEHFQYKPHGKGTLELSESLKHNGIFKMGLAHGWGTITDSITGGYLSGEFIDNELPYGIISGLNKYEGQLQGLNAHGQGKLILLNGDVLEGQWVNSQLQGQVIVRNNYGSVYQGHWIYNKPNGKGVLKWTVKGKNYLKELFEGNISGQKIEFDEEKFQLVTFTELVEQFNDDQGIEYTYEGIWQNGDYIYGHLYAGDKSYQGLFKNNRIQNIQRQSSQSIQIGYQSNDTQSDKIAISMDIQGNSDKLFTE